MGSGFEWSLGTLLVGIFLNTYLFGIVSYQFGVYFTTRFNDPLWIKSTVVLLCITDIFHSIAVIYLAWEYCVTNFTNPEMLTVALWPYPFTPIGTAVAAVMTQNFLGYRIFKLTKNKYIYGAILFFSSLSFASGVACGARAWIIGVTSKLSVLQPLVAFWLGLQTGLDLTIAAILTYLLYTSRTGLRHTDNILRHLIRGSVQTGIFAAIFAMGDLIAFLMSTSNLYGMFAIPLGRIYTTTLMDTLIMRRDLRDAFRDAIDMDLNVEGLRIANPVIRRPNSKKKLQPPTISVHTEIHRDSSFIRTPTSV